MLLALISCKHIQCTCVLTDRCATGTCTCTCTWLCMFHKVRSQWKSSRFFFGKNRVLQAALGRTEAEEYREGLAGLAKVHVPVHVYQCTMYVYNCTNIVYVRIPVCMYAIPDRPSQLSCAYSLVSLISLPCVS